MSGTKARYIHLVAVGTMIIGMLLSAPGAAKEEILPEDQYIYLHWSGFVSLLSDMPEYSNNSVGLGWSGLVGWRHGNWGLFFQVDRDNWMASDLEVEWVPGVLNLGAGADMLLFSERVKISLAAGTSTLMFDTIFDSAGTTGIFVEMKPASLRWPIGERFVFEITPITCTVLVPVLHEPRLVRLEYRSLFGFEVRL